jgi:hypothetical protein
MDRLGGRNREGKGLAQRWEGAYPPLLGTRNRFESGVASVGVLALNNPCQRKAPISIFPPSQEAYKPKRQGIILAC